MATVTEQDIQPNPYRPGVDEAVLGDFGIPVWAVVGAIVLAHATPDEVARDYQIPVAAVRAALAYYERHKDAIDARIAANQQFAA
jgi:uncharacterized protein (DUF433 family)